VSERSKSDEERHETHVPTIKLSVHGITPAHATSPADVARAAALATERSRAKQPPPEEKRRGVRTGDVVGGRYVIEGTIGRGGMGRVLQVRHQALGKAFALKVIKVPIAHNARIRDMFYREARLASALSHDNICSVVDFGEDEQFGLFMVMELLEGTTLFKKMQFDGRFAPKVACDIIWQVGEALRYIHSRAVIHGDIKSENIFLTRTPDRRRVVKLLDFGLARAEAALRGDAKPRVEGTPHYLAPERIHGDPPSQQTDIYALGVLFYELLTGKLPFHGNVESIFRNHLETPLPSPSSQIDEPIDERADEIVARATAKTCADRHQDAAHFVYELRTLMNMLGIDKGRRRPGASDKAVPRRGSSGASDAAVELFEWAPVPLASVTVGGKVQRANHAFYEFLGVADGRTGVDLEAAGLVEVHPGLYADLAACAKGRTIKRVIRLSEGGGHKVEVALILTPPPSTEAKVTAGQVHIALHPLARRDSD